MEIYHFKVLGQEKIDSTPCAFCDACTIEQKKSTYRCYVCTYMFPPTLHLLYLTVLTDTRTNTTPGPHFLHLCARLQPRLTERSKEGSHSREGQAVDKRL